MPITLTNTAPAANASRNSDQDTKHAAGGQRVVINGRLGIGKTSTLSASSVPSHLFLSVENQDQGGSK